MMADKLKYLFVIKPAGMGDFAMHLYGVRPEQYKYASILNCRDVGIKSLQVVRKNTDATDRVEPSWEMAVSSVEGTVIASPLNSLYRPSVADAFQEGRVICITKQSIEVV
jgi:hypothetical protein